MPFFPLYIFFLFLTVFFINIFPIFSLFFLSHFYFFYILSSSPSIPFFLLLISCFSLGSQFPSFLFYLILFCLFPLLILFFLSIPPIAFFPSTHSSPCVWFSSTAKGHAIPFFSFILLFPICCFLLFYPFSSFFFRPSAINAYTVPFYPFPFPYSFLPRFLFLSKLSNSVLSFPFSMDLKVMHLSLCVDHPSPLSYHPSF